MRWLYLHSYDEDASVERTIAVLGGIVEGEIESSKQDFYEFAMHEGGWDGWPAAVANRRAAFSNEPFYDGAFILVGEGLPCKIGTGNGAVIDAFLDAGKPVWAWNGADDFAQVQDAYRLDWNAYFIS